MGTTIFDRLADRCNLIDKYEFAPYIVPSACIFTAAISIYLVNIYGYLFI